MLLEKLLNRIKQVRVNEGLDDTESFTVGLYAGPDDGDDEDVAVELSDDQRAQIERLRAEIPQSRIDTLMDRYGESWEEVLNVLLENAVLYEAKSQDTNFDTYSAAVQYALDLIPGNLSYEDDEYHNIVASGTKKPGAGKTTSFKLPLYNKAGKHVKLLVVNVYNKDSDKKPYELNAYVS